ncbi:MAG: alginate lyase family protein [Phycisphaeraceae bacterium]
MPDVYLSHRHLGEIRQRVEAGAQPWADAHARLVAAADEAMQQEPLHVRMNGGSPYFRVDGVYLNNQDGVHDPDADTEGRKLAGRTSDASWTLALAYQLTGNTAYADHALTLIHTWCINQNTRMFPTGRVQDAATPGGAYGGDVVMFASFRKLFLAAYLLDDYGGWDLRSRAGVVRWIKAMLDPQRELMYFNGREMYNNWEDERLLYLACGALAIRDLDLLRYTFDRFVHTLPMKMTDEGELHRETMRTRSMSYTLMSLHGSLALAEIARAYGVDLYDVNINGRTLKLAADYAAAGLLDMASWPHKMIRPLGDEFVKGGSRMSVFELAHRQWGEPRYMQIIEQHGGRPVTADHATLLYAER